MTFDRNVAAVSVAPPHTVGLEVALDGTSDEVDPLTDVVQRVALTVEADHLVYIALARHVTAPLKSDASSL